MKPKNRLEMLRNAGLKQLAHIGPFVRGTLVRIKHPKYRHVAHRLTFKVNGKTKAVYIPLDMIEEVLQWMQNYRQLKKLIRLIHSRSLAIIRRHVPAKRAAAKTAARLRRN